MDGLILALYDANTGGQYLEGDPIRIATRNGNTYCGTLKRIHERGLELQHRPQIINMFYYDNIVKIEQIVEE